VAQNNCIYLGRDKHYYSVPYTYIGEKVQVIYTRTLVKIFCKTVLIATHERKTGFGYTVISEHLCSAHQHYNVRNPTYYIETAKKKSIPLSQLMEYIFSDTSKPQEVFYKTCDGLLSLCRKTDPVLFQRACEIALEEGVFSYRFIKSLIENKSLLLKIEDYKTLPQTLNVRGKQYYK
jgi:hypothetical protein